MASSTLLSVSRRHEFDAMAIIRKHLRRDCRAAMEGRSAPCSRAWRSTPTFSALACRAVAGAANSVVAAVSPYCNLRRGIEIIRPSLKISSDLLPVLVIWVKSGRASPILATRQHMILYRAGP